MRIRTFLFATALAAAAAALTGCGGGRAENDDVQRVVERFYGALRQQDAKTACDQLSDSAVQMLEGPTGKHCEEVLPGLQFDGGAVTGVEVYITSAQATLRGGERAFLSQETDGWKVTAAGCKPAPGAAATRPADCEVEG
jgi:hypothetical protein